MSDVQHVDFGKERREFERKLGDLMGLVERQREELVKDPVKFYARAVDEIMALQQFVEEIREASRIPLQPLVMDEVPTLGPRPMMVPREDYDRMRRVLARVDKGVVRM